jgi:YD repeat-containing protein
MNVLATATQVDFSFPGAADDANGKGVAWYALDRSPAGQGNYTRVGELVQSFGQFSDKGVQHSTAYDYRIWIVDYHSNLAFVDFSATTAPQNSVEPRQTGLPPNVPTYGALGASINLLSGNVNFNLPLLRAQARGGWSVGFSLNHDTQTWRKVGSKVWKYGVDTGYGYGWKLLAGSVMRYFSGTYQTSHFIFTDSTGTEYRLDRKVQADGTNWTTGPWDGYWASSSANFYGIFQEDWAYYRMKFPDGSSWFFGSHSAGTENDMGMAYPTLFQDSNGNQVAVRYMPGTGAGWANSSGRIDEIEDIRATTAGGYTYKFNYSNDSIPHLTSIVNSIGTAEGYTFGANEWTTQQLNEPFGSTPWANSASTKFLTGMVVNGVNVRYGFDYQWPWTGELSKVTLPFGGYVRWAVGEVVYTGGRSTREVYSWIHSKSPLGSAPDEKSYYIGHETNTSSLTLHTSATVQEPDGSTLKSWTFNANGRVTQHDVIAMPGWVSKLRVVPTWTTDTYGKPYIGSTTTTWDLGQGVNEKWKRTDQLIDIWGNVTQTKLYDWNNSTTAKRIFDNTYADFGSSVFLKNRVSQQTFTQDNSTVTTIENAYDQYIANCPVSGGCAMATVSNPRLHDTATYTTSYTTRGNLTSSRSRGEVNWIWGKLDQTGNAVASVGLTGVQQNTVWGNNNATPTQLSIGSYTDSMSWTSFYGQASYTGGNGTTSTIYDTYARPSSSTSQTGAVTTFAYANPSNAPATVTATTNGRWVKETLDGFGRVFLTEAGQGATTESKVESVYQPCACSPIGKLKQTSRPYKTGSPVWTVYAYNSLGRTTSITAPDGSPTTFAYLGNKLTVTDPQSKWKTHEQDEPVT